MHWDLALLGVGVLAGAVAWSAWRNRPRAGATSLAAMMLCVIIWSVAHLWRHHGTGRLVAGLEKLQFAALVPIGFLVFAFVLAYTGRRRVLTRAGLTALFAWPGLLIVLVLLPADLAGPLAVWPAVASESGTVFWVHVALSYGLLAVGSALLVDHAGSTVGLFRRQALALLAGIAFAWAGSLVGVFELFGSLHLHALQLGLAAMGVCFLWAVVGTGLTRVNPVARKAIVETLEAGVLAFDDASRITTLNPAARELLDLPAPASVVGEPVSEALAHHPDLADWLAELDTAAADASRTFPVGDRYVSCQLSQLSDDGTRVHGGALVLWDVTEQRRQREQLERQNGRLEQFRSTISHDLRSPLTVAAGHLELEREAHEDDSEHLAAIENALDHMESLIEDLRVLAETGQAIETTERVRLEPAVNSAWRLVDTETARVTVNPDGVFMADPDRLRQLLSNLLSNAVEHGSTGDLSANDAAVEAGSSGGASETGEVVGQADSAITVPAPKADRSGDIGVEIRVGATPDGFFVADDGPGVPEDRRDSIFEEGYSTGDDGMGLGLSIVTDVAEAHGWDIEASESTMGGLRVDITGVERPNSST